MQERELTDAELESLSGGKGPVVAGYVTGRGVMGAGAVFGRERSAGGSAPAPAAGGCANGRCPA